MKVNVGIVGLPNVGKSTIFNALTETGKADVANYPFCTIDPNVGIVNVPDRRLKVLSQISGSKKIIPATMEFVDIAGLVKGASKGEGLGNQFLSNIRNVSAIAPVEILEETVIGPTLGKESIQKTVKAGLTALVLVGLFMIWRYAISGFISVIALMFNGLMLWAAMVALDVTLTLPGIAGIILNIGMAVDANVIIFERIKEELRTGKTLRIAIEEGFKRAFGAIFDAQVTTLIAAFVLFQFGTGPLKGFAATLSIGTITSIFAAVFITKVFLDLILGGKKQLKYAF